jgi:hypothetical protein
VLPLGGCELCGEIIFIFPLTSRSKYGIIPTMLYDNITLGITNIE